MDVDEARVVMNGVLVRKRPARRPAACHAKGADHLRVLAQGIREELPLSIALRAEPRRRLSIDFVSNVDGDDGGRPRTSP